MLKEARALRKHAQEKIAEISGENPDSMPGAENDKPVEVPKEDAEVNDGSMGPKSSRSTDGKGDDRPITAGDLFESDESIVNPEKKPLDTDDANAKEASAGNIANDILSMIHSAQEAEKKAEAQKKAEAPAAKKAEEKVQAKKPETPSKQASSETPLFNLDITTAILAKLACAMTAEKEGADLAERVIAKQAGAERAKEVMEFLAGQEKAAEEYAAGQRDAEARIYVAAKQAEEYEAGQRDAERLILLKRAQDLGAADADDAIAAMAAASPEAAAGDAGLPEDAAGAPDDAAGVPAEDDMLPEDAVAEVLIEQLANGNITEEDLAEIVAELAEEDPETAQELGIDVGVDAGAEGDAAAAEGEAAAADDAAAAAAADEAAAAADAGAAADEKVASAKKPGQTRKQAGAKSVVEKRAMLMRKIACASKLLAKHLQK